ncbi:uncharacterized protein LOC121384091 isoform X2 [Gigantopelta aegis]|nr:uncharacterized protein LOC121384091 isoform X2 [Gigantopelta aegis]
MVKDNVRQVSVKYAARSRPRVYWNMGWKQYTENGFKVVDDYSDSEGETSLIMPTDHFTEDPDIRLWVSFTLDDFSLVLQLRRGDILMNSFADETFKPIYLTIRPGDSMSYSKGDIVYLNASVASEDHTRYRVGHTSLMLEALDYSFSPPNRVQRFALGSLNQRVMREDRKALVLSAMMPSPSTSNILSSSTAILNTTYDLTEGRLLFTIEVGVNSRIIEGIIMTRGVYVKEHVHESPFMENSLTFVDGSGLSGGQFDDSITSSDPRINIRVIGNPRPTVKLYRGCEQLKEPEITKLESGSRFTADVTFMFNNFSQAVEGAYLLVATSGTKQLRDIFSVDVISY